MANQSTDAHFDPDARREEILRRFRALDPKEARRELAVLPYYHAVENAITKPNQGTYVTRYFVTKWRPVLGSEAASIVQALRLLADRADGTTIAGYDTIASYAGVSRRAVERWLTTNESSLADRSDSWKRQWRVLHTYFVLDKIRRYKPSFHAVDGKKTHRVQLSTYAIRVAMDDPVHPDDVGKLYAEAAERMVQDEMALHSQTGDGKIGSDSFTRPTGGQRFSPVENEPFTRPTGGLPVTPNGRHVSYSYRLTSTNVSDTNRLGNPSGPVPEVDLEKRETLAHEIGDQLKRLAGDRDPDIHKSLGFHRRVASMMPERLVREALTAVRDAADDQRAGRRTLHRGYAAYFAGVIRKIADREQIDLGVEWSAQE
jgi:hypothetical protein